MNAWSLSGRRGWIASFAVAMIIGAFLLTGCGAQSTSTVSEVSGDASTPEAFPALPVLPARAPVRATATIAPTPILEPDLSPTALPVQPTPAPSPSADASNPMLLPGVYVTAASANLSGAPGGPALFSAPAGTRLGVLARTQDSAWLQVLYQPDPEQQAISGWVRSAAVTAFSDLANVAPWASNGAETASSPAAGVDREGAQAAMVAVLADRLNLRAGPGASERVIGVLTRGQQVQALGQSADGIWQQVQTASGNQGWAAAQYLQAGGGPVPAARPATAAGQGQIVFQSRSGGDIYIMNSNGSDLRRLTTGLDPAFSPDGRQVAFTRWEEPRGLWLINSDGSGERLVLGANRARSPSWSADGGSIVFEQSAGGKVCRNSPFGCLTDDELRQRLGGECVDTPFGRFCISDFPLSSLDFTTLVRFDLADGSTRNLPASDSARAPVIQPGAQRIVYADRDGLAATQAAGDGQPARLVTAKLPQGAVTFSPDGRFIFGSQRDGDSWNIWRWTADGGQAQALTQPPALRSNPVHNVAPTVSPDGRTLLFLSNRRGNWEVWQMGVDGSNPQPFAPAALSGLDFKYDFNQERMIDWGRRND